MKVAKERKSAVLASNAVHHRIDSLTSVVALSTIGGAHIFSNASWLDPVGGLLISLMVIRAGWGNTLQSLLELGDVTVDQDVKQAVKRAATKAIEGDLDKGFAVCEGAELLQVREVQGTKSGQNYLMDVEIAVPGSWAVQQLAPVEEVVRERVGAKVRGVRRVRVKFSTLQSEGNFTTEFIGADTSPRSSPAPDDGHDHSHDHIHNHESAHNRGTGQAEISKKLR